MICQICDVRTITTNSRPGEGSVRRRHRCPKCDDRFTTVEIKLDDTGRVREGLRISRALQGMSEADRTILYALIKRLAAEHWEEGEE